MSQYKGAAKAEEDKDDPLFGKLAQGAELITEYSSILQTKGTITRDDD